MRTAVIALALLCATLAGCTLDPHPLDWGCDLAGSTRAVRVQARILRGGCDGTVEYSVEISPGGGLAMQPPRLASGRFGLACRARDASCVWFAEGCVEVDLPLAPPREIRVPLAAAPFEEPACDSTQCNLGTCVGSDGGRPDASTDAGARDAGRDTGIFDGGECGPSCLTDCCGGACVDTATDESHCGMCGMPCGAGQTCCGSACIDTTTSEAHCGMCGMACDAGETCCSGTCADTESDEDHCGMCGMACDGFQDTCCGGSCVSLRFDEDHCGECGESCGGATDRCCEMDCVDTDTDPDHCSTCNMSCGAATCAGGVCGTPSCGGELVMFDGRCTDPLTEVESCGETMVACSDDRHCRAGLCRCRPGLSFSSGSCVDLQSDSNNCGTLGMICPVGTLCERGICDDICGPGLTDCTASGYPGCVDLMRDPVRCGTCTTRCANDQVCVAGTCRFYDPGVDVTAGAPCATCPCMSCTGRTCCTYGPNTICVSGTACP